MAKEEKQSEEVPPCETLTATTSPQQTGDSPCTEELRKKLIAFYLTFVAILVNLFLYALDATTLAAIAADLNGTSLESFWASISYLLSVAVTQPLYATLSDVLGRKPCLYAAYAFFFTGLMVFALAKTMRVVVAGRVLQGLGGGGLDVLSEIMIIVTDMTTLQERSLYLGLMAIPTALGSVLGPTVGGVFSSLVSWRWIGWINLPLLGISFPLTVVFLKLRSLQHSPLSELRRLDWTGVFLFTAWIILFALPLSWAGNLYAWDSFRTLLPLLFGVTILVAFAFYEGKAITPIMPHRIFKSRTASATLLSVFIHGVSLYSLLQWLPLLYQAIMAKTVLSSAVTLLPTSATSVVAAVGGVTIVGLANIGYRWSIRVAWAFTAAGTGLLVLLDADSTASIAYGLPVIWGAGIGLLLRLLFLPLQASVVRVDDTGLAIGILLTFRLLGGLVGLSICSTIFSSYFSRSLDSIGSLPISLEHLRDPEAAIAFIPQLRALDLPDTILEPIIHAYLTSIRAVVYAMTGFASLGFLSSFFIQELTLEKTEMGQQQFED
ncbi:Permease major facilitator superprotein [Pyrenophora tritici-repentis]|nr:Permease major facilitator superprotein [Pyrenophora tritici-repentis]